MCDTNKGAGLVSVIVPVYKVELYLRDCVDSILAQTYQNIELILVDDGSPDNCPAICDEYAARDKRVSVIHQKNRGLSAARNSGLRVMKGDYVAFIDSDDFVHERYIEQLVYWCRRYNAEVCICCDVRVAGDALAKDYVKKPLPAEIKTDCVDGRQANYRRFDGPMACETILAACKIYSAKLFEQYRFPENVPVHEDEALIYRVLYDAAAVVYIDAELHFYRQNQNGIMGSHNKKGSWDKNFLALPAFRERAEFYRSVHEDELCAKHLEWEIKTLASWLGNISPDIEHPQQIQKRLHDELWWAYRGLPKSLSAGRRVKYTLIAICPNAGYRLYAIIKYAVKEHCPSVFSMLKTAKKNYLGRRNKLDR